MTDPVVLLPGILCDARVFLHQILDLGRTRAVMICLPVQGASVEDMSAAVLDVAPPKFSLVGQGLGGAVALDVLRRAIGRVSHIALISTDPLAEAPQTAVAREGRMIAAKAGRMGQAMREELPPSALFQGPDRNDILDLVADMALGLGPATFVAQSRALQRRPDQQKTLRRISIPALVLAGADDPLVPVRRQEFVANLMPSARIQIIDGAGHLPSIEQPGIVSAALEAFLGAPLLLR